MVTGRGDAAATSRSPRSSASCAFRPSACWSRAESLSGERQLKKNTNRSKEDTTVRKYRLQITQKAAHADADALRAALPTLALSLTNYSGAEYSYYVATDEKGVAYDAQGPRRTSRRGSSTNVSSARVDKPALPQVEAIWPASERQVQRKRPGEIAVFEETAEAYVRRAGISPTNRGGAAAATWIVRGDAPRPRRG